MQIGCLWWFLFALVTLGGSVVERRSVTWGAPSVGGFQNEMLRCGQRFTFKLIKTAQPSHRFRLNPITGSGSKRFKPPVQTKSLLVTGSEPSRFKPEIRSPVIRSKLLSWEWKNLCNLTRNAANKLYRLLKQKISYIIYIFKSVWNRFQPTWTDLQADLDRSNISA